MKKAVQLGYLLALAALAAWPAAAQETRTYREGNTWVEVVTGTLPAARNLKVTADAGSVNVTGGPQQGITFTVKKRYRGGSEAAARREFDLYKIKPSSKMDWAVLQGFWQAESHGRLSVEFVVNAPRDIDLVRIATAGGSVGVENIAGRLMASTSGGSVSINDIGGSVTAETAGGSIRVGNTGGDVRLETAGGSITVASANGEVIAETAGGSIDIGTAARAVTAETAGGSIQVQKCGGELRATTAGGSVEAGEVAGPATMETSGGSIRLGSANGSVRATTSGGGIKLMKLTHGVHARTAAGPVYAEFVTRPGQFTDSYLETSVGDVVVYLPPDLPVTVRAIIDTAFGHRIRSEFSEMKVNAEGPEWGPKEIYGDAAINGGGPVLKIHTTQGNIDLRRGRK